ncbi:MAG: trypsin-like peptidase domain-containing protein [Zhaonellaceae bacterium]|jgi:serine protease Do
MSIFDSKKSFTICCIIVLILAAGLAYAYTNEGLESVIHADVENSEEAKEPVAAQQASLIPPGLNANTIAEMVEQAGPAVVKIETTSEVKNPYANSPFNDPFFRYFFGDSFNAPESRVTQGLGSGFIISRNGYILTNEHVVSGATDIQVVVSGYEKSFPAQVIGKDYDLDLAVLKIDSDKPLPTLKLGDSDKIKVGNWVVAIGNPLGLDHTVTVGVISAKERPITIQSDSGQRQFKNLLQTDASINPGNSGGPLLNLNGEVIGINTAVSSSGQGIGFAIPSSTVQKVLQELIEKGQVTRPWIGVYMQPLTKELADYFGLDKEEGVVVTDVIPGSPAAKAGLRRKDIILEFNNKVIKNPNQLQEAVQEVKIGSKVTALIWRDGTKQYVTMTITQKETP